MTKKWDRINECFICGGEMTEKEMVDCRSCDLKYGGYAHNYCHDLMIRYAKWRSDNGRPLCYDPPDQEITKDKIEFIAAFRHFAWCCYQMGAGQEFNEVINQDQLESLKQGVEYALKNPGMSAEENHENWMKMKESQGWNYGPVKDFEKKTHPDMIPYDNLPEVEKRKDDMDIMAQDFAVNLWNLFVSPVLNDNEVKKPEEGDDHISI